MSQTDVQRGRPTATTHAEIERAAFELFNTQGFDQTTLEAIAARIGVSRRTITRYYPSKNDIPWGQFAPSLTGFRTILADTPADLPLWQQVQRAILAFNDFPTDANPSHRDRMHLILHTPTLQAHSVLRYEQWRRLIAAHVAVRTGQHASDRLPRLVGHISLALAISAYEQWLDTAPPQPQTTLRRLIEASMEDLRAFVR